MLVKVVHPTQLSETTEQTIPRMVFHFRLKPTRCLRFPTISPPRSHNNSSELLNITCEHTQEIILNESLDDSYQHEDLGYRTLGSFTMNIQKICRKYTVSHGGLESELLLHVPMNKCIRFILLFGFYDFLPTIGNIPEDRYHDATVVQK
jgi:hypothetical protein